LERIDHPQRIFSVWWNGTAAGALLHNCAAVSGFAAKPTV
jgi:hypothetical protein